jgi:hypothetical protein
LVPPAIAPVAINGTDFIYSVAPGATAADQDPASHFGDFMAGRHPGVSFTVFSCTNMQSW